MFYSHYHCNKRWQPRKFCPCHYGRISTHGAQTPAEAKLAKFSSNDKQQDQISWILLG